MKKTTVITGLLALAASVAIPVGLSDNYSPSNSAVERILAGDFIADGSPRPPLPPSPSFDGSPRPPLPPALALSA